MALLGNILWFIFFGWWSFLGYGLLGILWCITIIGIPIGKALFQYAKLMAFPFGKVIIRETDLKGKENVSTIRRVGGIIANILWLPFGIITFIANIGAMIVCAITIIGIPFAVVIARSSIFLLWPIGAKVITKEEADALKMQRMMNAAPFNQGMMPPQADVPQQITSQQAIPVTVTPQEIPVSQTFQQSQQNTAQPSQILESIKESGGKTISAVTESGGKAISAITESGEKALTATAAAVSAGAFSLRNRQKVIKESVLAKETEMAFDEMLTQMEVKLYHNSAMAWIMPFLEYITAALGVISAVVGLIVTRSFWGLFYGVGMMTPVLLAAALLGMIKRNRIFVAAVLTVQILPHIVSIIF
ncbi:MAG: hypothetical protein NC251_13975 [Lachnoclostridium sp.]|nr:hypothetical protein [Lachnospira sp.]MCM1249510.1 hypothetical protein [Lachnoclostridium sp.]MCM1534893.1 hypothetical protein [Clostridium sp.]